MLLGLGMGHGTGTKASALTYKIFNAVIIINNYKYTHIKPRPHPPHLGIMPVCMYNFWNYAVISVSHYGVVTKASARRK